VKNSFQRSVISLLSLIDKSFTFPKAFYIQKQTNHPVILKVVFTCQESFFN